MEKQEQEPVEKRGGGCGAGRGGEEEEKKNVMSGKQHCYYQVNEGSYPSTLLVTRAHHIPNALAIRT